jgi:ATP-binding cassette, subfamily G (WHITE), member 2, SNQ2
LPSVSVATARDPAVCFHAADLQTIINSMQAVEPVTLVFNNLSYAVPIAGGSKTLLSNVSGYALPGTLTALMGASGAGKTTLLDVISGRKTGGVTTGEILANGVPKDGRIFPKITGYVEQSDIHDPYCTVREGLTFSARLVR